MTQDTFFDNKTFSLDLSLIFTHVGPNLQQLEHMLQAIDDDTTTLKVTGNRLSDLGEYAPAIFQLISKLPKLTSLDLSSNDLGDLGEHATAAFEAISEIKTLTSLDLSSNDLGDLGEHTPAALQALSKLPKLTSLDLSENSFVNLEEQAPAAFQALSETTITSLALRQTYLGNLGRHAPAAFEALSKLHQLKSLNLSHNHLGIFREDAPTALQALSKLPKLTSLSLDYNYLGNLGKHAPAVFQAFSKIETLTSLDLRYNELGILNPHATAAFQALSNLHRPISLDLSYNCNGSYLQLDVRDKSIQALAQIPLISQSSVFPSHWEQEITQIKSDDLCRLSVFYYPGPPACIPTHDAHQDSIPADELTPPTLTSLPWELKRIIASYVNPGVTIFIDGLSERKRTATPSTQTPIHHPCLQFLNRCIPYMSHCTI